MTIVLRRKINYHLLQTYLPSGRTMTILTILIFSSKPSSRTVCDCCLALSLPAPGGHPREGDHGHDHPAHLGRHVRGCETEHSQSELCVSTGCLDVCLHRLCLLHSSRVCHRPLVCQSLTQNVTNFILSQPDLPQDQGQGQGAGGRGDERDQHRGDSDPGQEGS